MRSRALLLFTIALTTSFLQRTSVDAAPPWEALLPFDRIGADPNRSYPLTKEHGPWLILAANFSGQGAKKKAHDLVLELRSRYKLPAYIHEQEYDYTGTIPGLGVTPEGKQKRMRHLRNTRYDGIAVLVGDFETIDDARLQQALETIKYAHPKSLQYKQGEVITQRMYVLRELQKQVQERFLQKQSQTKGPMGFAFATPNPLLPKEFFAPKGLDPVVASMNEEVEYSLLDCGGKYTVKVATFHGASTMRLDEIKKYEQGGALPSKLVEAAEKAHRLTLALRRRGVEAYEFHDREESIVTVGAFDSLGKPLPGGKIDFDPVIATILKQYAARRIAVPGTGNLGLQPRKLDGIEFDAQPIPMETPRVSIAQSYAPRNKMFR